MPKPPTDPPVVPGIFYPYYIQIRNLKLKYLNLVQFGSYYKAGNSGTLNLNLDNCCFAACKTFVVQALSWSLEFVIFSKPQAQHYPEQVN